MCFARRWSLGLPIATKTPIHSCELICQRNARRCVPDPRTAVADVNFGAVLLEDVIPFWVRHGWDQLYGGVITSLDRDGSVLDTDKSVWFQGRAGWMFATLYNTV